MNKIATSSALVSMAILLAAGCGVIDREVDCNKICNKKKDCIDNNYNVSSCVDYCRSQAKASDSYNQQVNDCSACIETRACAQTAECYAKASCPSLP